MLIDEIKGNISGIFSAVGHRPDGGGSLAE
jgi:hypothetical protein